jgi:beta-galactosidase
MGDRMTRRDWLKKTAAASGIALLPEFTEMLAGQAGAASTGQSPAAASQAGAATKPVMTPGRERLLADFGWCFHLGHANDVTKDFNYGNGQGSFAKSGSFLGGGRGGPSSATFDESSWTPVDLPHDWAVDLPFDNNRSLDGHGYKPLGRAYPETSIGWYRRAFDIPATDNGRRISIEFDGVFRDAVVILNNHYIGRNLSGYTPFRFDVTDFITYGGKNVLVVRCDATEGEGWFYEGAGIYRHVWIVKTAPVHVAPTGMFVTTEITTATQAAAVPTVALRPASAMVRVSVEVANDSDQTTQCSLALSIVDEHGTHVGFGGATVAPFSIAPWARRTLSLQSAVESPNLWSIESPTLHRAIVTVRTDSGKTIVDTNETPFGICTRHWDADKGFFLNGKHVEIKGTCNHQDHAGVGSGLPDALQAYRIQRLKDMGCNAYRTSHNPPTRELLDACDRLGMLVLDETRMMSSNEEGLSELEHMIRRDRNHPSIFAWSIGNEEPEQSTDRGAREVTTMKRLVHELDPTRLITEAMNNSWGRGVSNVVDIQGFNYHTGGTANNPPSGKEIDDYHAQHPRQFTMGTEVASTVSTRGIYENDQTKGYVSAYDRNYPAWASTAENWWTVYDARPFVAGGFVWTGFDYRGEPTPYRWPCINSHFGIIDMCGFEKDLFYYYRAWWTNEPTLHLFPHWNWAGKEGQEIEVWCFTNLESVELFVNGMSAGSQTVTKNSHVAWKVPYAPGAIEARGTKGGQVTLTDKRETTGVPARLMLHADRRQINGDGEDVANVRVEVLDAQGRIVPIAGNEVTFIVTGTGRLIGVGNGDPSSHEADRPVRTGETAVNTAKRSAFNGLAMAIVQAAKGTGEIRVEASAAGLSGDTIVVFAQEANARPAL